jgi:hypothetical protein
VTESGKNCLLLGPGDHTCDVLSENQRKGCQNFRTFDYCSIFLSFLSSKDFKDFKPTRSAKFSTCFHRSTLKLSIKVVFPFLFNQYFFVFSQPVIIRYILYALHAITCICVAFVHHNMQEAVVAFLFEFDSPPPPAPVSLPLTLAPTPVYCS